MSTRVWRIDRTAVVQRLSAWAERLVRDPDVLGVILFGSYARGDATAASDADILIILRDTSLTFEERIGRYKPVGMGVAVEVFPYTVAEALRSLKEGWGVVGPAVREGRRLAGATFPNGASSSPLDES